jgi:PEP-CTERM motif
MKNKNIFRSSVIMLGLMAGFPLASRADSIIFNDFGAGHSYNSQKGLTIAGTQSMPGFVEWGEAFTPHGRFDLTEISMALGWFAGVNGVTVSLDTNIGGAPGTAVASWSFVGLPQFGTTNSTVQTMTFARGIVLLPGQTYWLVAAPLGASTQAVWNLNSTGVTGLAAVNFGTGWLTTKVPSGAFEVFGQSVVPEPGTWFLFGTGLLAVLAAIRKKKPVPARAEHMPVSCRG